MPERALFTLEEVLQSFVTASIALAFHAFWMVKDSTWFSVRMVIAERTVVGGEDGGCTVVEGAV